MVPDRIIVWNNSGSALEPLPGVEMVDCMKNYGPLARYAIALTAAVSADRGAMRVGAEDALCLFQDDDLCVGFETVRRLADVVRQAPQTVAGAIGVRLNRENRAAPYSTSTEVSDGAADVILGRLHMCRAAAIGAMYGFLARHGIDGIYREDDIVLPLSNLALGGRNRAVPVAFLNLEENGQGLSHQPEHYPLRDHACRWFLERLPA